MGIPPAGNHHFPKSMLTVGGHAEAPDSAEQLQKNSPLLGGAHLHHPTPNTTREAVSVQKSEPSPGDARGGVCKFYE